MAVQTYFDPRDPETAIYQDALRMLKAEQLFLGSGSSTSKQIKIDFDVDNLQIKINATLDAEVVPTDNGAEISIKARAIYNTPQPVTEEPVEETPTEEPTTEDSTTEKPEDTVEGA